MITSTSNTQIRALIALQKKAKLRKEEDVYLCEGIKLFAEAPAQRIVQIVVSESFYQKNSRMVQKKLEAVKRSAQSVERTARELFLQVSDPVFAAISDTKTPQGILCILRQEHYSLTQLLGKALGDTAAFGKSSEDTAVPAKASGEKDADPAPCLVVLENLQDPGNLGTIFRTAEGAGMTGILLSADCVDLYNPKVIRSTMGAVFRMPFLYSKDLETDIRHLKQQGIRFYAAHLEGSVPYDEPNYNRGTAFLIGNESQGLSEKITACCDTRIRIPMCGQVESLNAGVASAILMYESLRQRRQ